VYIYIYTCINTYIYMCICIYVYTYICTYLNVHIYCLYVHIYFHTLILNGYRMSSRCWMLLPNAVFLFNATSRFGNKMKRPRLKRDKLFGRSIQHSEVTSLRELAVTTRENVFCYLFILKQSVFKPLITHLF